MKRKNIADRSLQRAEHILYKQKRSLAVDRTAVFFGILKLFLLGCFLTGTVLFYVWSRVEVVGLNYKILEVTKEERRHFMKNEKLKIELATLSSPSRLSSMAKDRFHLKNPKHEQIIYMK
jgi:cell division protein FtsL